MTMIASGFTFNTSSITASTAEAHVVQYGTDKNEEKNIFDIIDGAIATVEDEKNMFVKMSVKDVKKCFSKELRALPVNSFKKVYG